MEIDILSAIAHGFQIKYVDGNGNNVVLKGVGDKILDVDGNEYTITKVMGGIPVDMIPVDYGSG